MDIVVTHFVNPGMLAHNAKQEKRISALFARMLKLQKEMGDKVDLKKSFPKL